MASDGTQADYESEGYHISDDGRYVAFTSFASNLDPDEVLGNHSCSNVFVHDLITHTTKMITNPTPGMPTWNDSAASDMTPDGRFIAISSLNSKLVPNDTNGREDVYRYDRLTGTTLRVSVSSGGGEATHFNDLFSGSKSPSISSDGNIIVFESDAKDLVGDDTNHSRDIFCHDVEAGETTLITKSSDGQVSNGFSQWARISGDGRYVAFVSLASNLALHPHQIDVFLADRITKEVRLVSKSATGEPGDNPSSEPQISRDGRFLVFDTSSTNFVANDANGVQDVYLVNLSSGAIERVSSAFDGMDSNDTNEFPEISATGRFITFNSNATNLVTGDANGFTDYFIREHYLPAAIQITSQTPNSGVPITVWTADQDGLKNGTTSFTRTYLTGHSASFTAPLSAGSNRFVAWKRDSNFWSSSRTVTLDVDGPATIAAVYSPVGTITFQSLNPDSGVPITVWTPDVNGATNGATSFVRTYYQGSQVSCTAPALVGSNYFLRWDLNGAPWLGTRTVQLTSGLFNKTVRAVYSAGSTLTVQSNATAVPITVWTIDKANQANGTTTFTRVYATGQSVSLTAPSSVGGKAFVRWDLDGVPFSTVKTVTVNMATSRTLKAVYIP